MQAHVLSVFYLISSPYCITSVISISRLLKPQCAYLASSEDIGVIEIHGGNDQGFRIHVSVPDGLRRGSRYWRRRCVCMCVCVCNVLILSFFSRYLSFKTVGSNIKHTKQLFDNHCFLKLHTHTCSYQSFMWENKDYPVNWKRENAKPSPFWLAVQVCAVFFAISFNMVIICFVKSGHVQ